MSDRPSRARQLALAAWLLLAACVALWPMGDSGIGWGTTALAGIPLLLPLAGIARGTPRAYRYATLVLTPVFVLAVTELLANAAARGRAAATLALILLAFATLIAALRSAPASRARKES
jgi:uncharacterized membrane protein